VNNEFYISTKSFNYKFDMSRIHVAIGCFSILGPGAPWRRDAEEAPVKVAEQLLGLVTGLFHRKAPVWKTNILLLSHSEFARLICHLNLAWAPLSQGTLCGRALIFHDWF
jgi:hypothetical protein